jgi:ribose 5-phosphate isomerase A
MNQDEKKAAVAAAALDYIENGQIVGIGSGTTVHALINQLSKVKNKIEAVVSSSELTTKMIQEKDIRVIDLKESGPLPLYIDGADESNSKKQLIKGGGGALTREKIIANASTSFVCMIDDSKLVKALGKFPLAIEVIGIAQSVVALELIKIGGRPVYRDGFKTDNGNIILDVHNLEISEPIALEEKINNIPGVVTNGLFAIRPADHLLVSSENNIELF